jgi:hypothetical protein
MLRAQLQQQLASDVAMVMSVEMLLCYLVQQLTHKWRHQRD